jgi:hypothetical protein
LKTLFGSRAQVIPLFLKYKNHIFEGRKTKRKNLDVSHNHAKLQYKLFVFLATQK